MTSQYEIVYYCGLDPMDWDPRDIGLGGAQQAVVHLSTNWSHLDHQVAVYGNLKWTGFHNGVYYYHSRDFNHNLRYKIFIMWSFWGCTPFVDNSGCLHRPICERLMIDLHGIEPRLYPIIASNLDKISNVMFKTQFHKNTYLQQIGTISQKFLVIPNGVRVKEFSESSPSSPSSRNPYRMCYCSSHDRGLYMILRELWPLIKQLEPRSEFHIYYGMNLITDPSLKEQVTNLLKSDGVINHGHTSLEQVIQERHLSSFHLYYTDTLGEIDCISIRESLVSGCIPIISDINVFAERDGLRFHWVDQNDPQFRPHLKHIATQVVTLMNQPEDTREHYRQVLRQSKTIIDWYQVANTWLKSMLCM